MTTLADNWSWNPVQQFTFSANPAEVTDYIMGEVDWLHAQPHLVKALTWGGWTGDLLLICIPSFYGKFIIVFLNAESFLHTESTDAKLHGHVADIFIIQESPDQSTAILSIPTTAWPEDKAFPIVAERFIGQWWHVLTRNWDNYDRTHTLNIDTLRGKIVENFNLEEIQNLCHDLDIPYEDLSGDTRTAKARELVSYAKRHARLDALIAYCRQNRPSKNWG